MENPNERESASVAALAALVVMFEEHRPRIRAMLLRRIDPALNSRLDVDDLLQESFLRARRRWAGFAESAMSPYAWLYRQALDCLIDAWRRETGTPRDTRRELPWPERSSVQLGLSLAGTATNPSQAVARAELRGRVQVVLDLLSSTDREILWMRHVDELHHREAAMVLGITEAAAMKRYARALTRFKDLWRNGLDPSGEISA